LPICQEWVLWDHSLSIDWLTLYRATHGQSTGAGFGQLTRAKTPCEKQVLITAAEKARSARFEFGEHP